MSPVLAFTWSLTAVTATCFLHHFSSLLVYAVGISVLLTLITGSISGVKIAAALTLPFAVPLCIIHGVLNPAFEVTYNLINYIPMRSDGFIFAGVVATRILVLSVAVVSWKEVEKDRVFTDAVRLRIPLAFIVMIAVATSTIKILTIRIQKVYIAQQARGIPAGPSINARIRALPSMLVPVVASTLIEADRRGILMINRGLGTRSMCINSSNKLITQKDCYISVLLIMWLVISWQI